MLFDLVQYIMSTLDEYTSLLLAKTRSNTRRVWKRLSVLKLIFRYLEGGVVASWLVRSSPDRAVQVRVPPGTLHCVLGQDILLSNNTATVNMILASDWLGADQFIPNCIDS